MGFIDFLTSQEREDEIERQLIGLVFAVATCAITTIVGTVVADKMNQKDKENKD